MLTIFLPSLKIFWEPNSQIPIPFAALGRTADQNKEKGRVGRLVMQDLTMCLAAKDNIYLQKCVS